MRRFATEQEMSSIRALVARGYAVTGHGYRYSVINGWLHIEAVEA